MLEGSTVGIHEPSAVVPGPTRLILIDSYSPGDDPEILIDGATSINGSNGAGKSTLLRMLPLYYGTEPRQMVRADGVTLSFADFYLPRPTSYIIFEYLRTDGYACAVLSSSGAERRPVWRFLKGAYVRSLFITEGAECEITPQDRLHHLVDEGQITRQLTPSEYRQVILNCASGTELRGYAAKFSAGGSGRRLENLDLVITQLFRRTSSLSDLKKLILQCVRESNEPLRLTVSQQQATQTADEARAHLEVMAQTGVAEDLRAEVDRLDRLLAELREDKARLVALERDETARAQAAGHAIARLNEDIEKREAARTQALKPIHDAHSKQRSAKQTAETDLAAIAAKAQQFKLQNIDRLIELRQNQPILLSRKNLLEERKAALVNQSAAVEDQFQRQLLTLQRAHLATAQHLEAEKAKCRNQQEQEASESAERAQQQLDELEARLEAERGELDARIAAATENFNRRNREIGAVTAAPELLAELAAINRAASAATEAHHAAELAHTSAEHEAKLSRVAFDAAEAAWRQANAQAQDHETKVLQIVSLIDASDATLLGFLRKNVSGWEHTIGKLVADDLLLRADLYPSLSEDLTTPPSLYGVTLNLDAVPSFAAASNPDDLAAAHAEALRTFAEQERVVAARLADFEAARVRVQDASQNVALAHSNLSRAADDVVAHNGRVATIKQRVEASLRARQAVAQQAFNEAEATLSAARSALADTVARGKRSTSDLKARLAFEEKQKRARHGEEIAKHEKMIRDAAAQAQRDEADLLAERDAILTEQGIDTAALKTVEGELASIEAELAELTRGHQLLSDWADFADSRDAKTAQYNAAIATATQEICRLEREESEINKEADAQILTWQTQLTEQKTIQRQAEQIAQHAHSRHVRLVGIDVDEAIAAAQADPNLTLAHIGTAIDARLARQESAEAAIAAKVALLRNVMKKYPGSGAAAFVDEIFKTLSPGASHVAWGREILPFFERRHAENERVLIQQLSTLEGQLAAYTNEVRRLRNRARNEATAIQQHIASTCNFGAIRQLRLLVETATERIQHWDKVTTAASILEEWKVQSGAQRLPGADDLKRLSDAFLALPREGILETDPGQLIDLSIEIYEGTSEKPKLVRAEHDLKHVSSNGLSFIILCMIFIGVVQRLRGDTRLRIMWMLDELMDLDLANTERLLQVLRAHDISLVAAYPEPDPTLLDLFDHGYLIQSGFRIAVVEPYVAEESIQEVSHV